MRAHVLQTRRSRGPHPHIVLLLAFLLAACGAEASPSPGATGVTAPPAATPAVTHAPSPTAMPTEAPATPTTPTPSPGAEPAADTFAPGALAMTVSDDLRVRSLPEVSGKSVKYTPLLSTGTQLVISGGPVKASGYTWYRVIPIGVTLKGGADEGWVAIADHDGTPWVALADDPTPGFELASVQVERPKAVKADAKAAAASVNAFGIALYKRMLRDPSLALADKGVVLSPASIAIALAMARAGARGTTATELDKVLRADDWTQFGAGISSLQQLLESRSTTWTDDGGGSHALAVRIANEAFAQQGWAVKQGYLQEIARLLGVGLGLVDYRDDPEAARQAINGWVARQTANRIKELLLPGDLTSDTKLALVNAIYLKAKWLVEFDKGSTQDRTFTTSDGSPIKVPTMHTVGGQEIPYAQGAGWQATELRYEGGPIAMTLVLPGDLGDFERSMTAATLSSIVKRLDAERKRLAVIHSTPGRDCDHETYAYDLSLYLPRFGLETRASLVPDLVAMGMTTAADRYKADFSGIVDPDPSRLYIQKVIHQANIDVDEEGTEAAAATAVIMGDTGGGCYPEPLREITLRLNRPFLFFLRDTQTGAVLFMGRVMDPSKR